EIGKVLLILFLAAFVVNRVRSDTPWKTVWGAVGLASLPMALVFKEPDFGSTLISGAALLAVLFFGGIPWKHLASLAVVTALVALSVLWFLPAAGVEVLDGYQKDRLIGVVNPEVGPSGREYNGSER